MIDDFLATLYTVAQYATIAINEPGQIPGTMRISTNRKQHAIPSLHHHRSTRPQ